jgi:histidine triad (HIT) family protein
MHVIPRWDGDNLHKPWDIAAATDEELDVTIGQLLN